MTALDNFWRHVRQGNSCWEWTGHPNGKFGYGRVMVNGRRVLAHRRAWELLVGPIPDGLKVLHRCDNPPCVRPDHLFLGTLADNNRDRDAKGRTSTGPSHAAASNPWRAALAKRKLSDGDVQKIRQLIAEGFSTRQIGPQFGIHHSYVSDIGRGKRR